MFRQLDAARREMSVVRWRRQPVGAAALHSHRIPRASSWQPCPFGSWNSLALAPLICSCAFELRTNKDDRQKKSVFSYIGRLIPNIKSCSFHLDETWNNIIFGHDFSPKTTYSSNVLDGMKYSGPNTSALTEILDGDSQNDMIRSFFWRREQAVMKRLLLLTVEMHNDNIQKRNCNPEMYNMRCVYVY